ncbi:pimeloyl-ACP methyl esterase BioG family protein [uncultured Muribaculum sp.]|uniref:pimeloyl-ACP methyl esterase BioG family protein n=1 Tax=uncultured Muribaculum sp. TaxID=1918613 RepID=UPI0025FB56B4|nr:pimeloyl-ACP methyl esterase BioG family protein [uncultured Muribaculum sp.]
MIQQLINHEPDNRDIIVIFLGWGTDAAFIKQLCHPGCDIMAVWDYRDETFDHTLLLNYRHVYIFAWSMGVMMAQLTLQRHPNLHPALCIAVNGSLSPVDDSTGIPKAIFQGTLAGLSDATLRKFRRRMCHTPEEFDDYCISLPSRGIDELRDELRILGERASVKSNAPGIRWDRAIIAESDRIFPIENMRRAWKGMARVRETSGGHLPAWQEIIDQEIIDKKYVASRFRRAIPTYDAHATAQKRIATRLWEMWRKELAGRTPLSIIEAGYGTGMMTRMYAPELKPYRLLLWDLCPTDISLPVAGEIIAGDAEELIAQLPDAYAEAVVSSSAMQWFNSPAEFIANAARVISKGGQLVISTFGERNMWELAQVTRLPLRYPTLDELCAMIPDDMRILVASQEEIVTRFDSPQDVLHHLKATGVNGMRGLSVPLRRIISDYPHTDDNSGVTLTYHPLYIIAEKL